MARQSAAVEVNAFVKGIVTEASPLTFPENASIDEVNLILNKDGSRRRRLGMDFEPDYTIIDSGENPTLDIGMSSFTWKSPGGHTENEFIVIQVGRRVGVYDSSRHPISANQKAVFTIGTDPSVTMTMTSVDGLLLIASGEGSINVLDWDGTTVTMSSGRLLIRDLFGVTDIVDGVDLMSGSGLDTRPTTRTQTHIYNLRNQTYAYPRYYSGDTFLSDPISSVYNQFGSYQSNSDNLVSYLYADANNSNDRNTKRYFGDDSYYNPLGTGRAPVGYFIIDALNRGASRLEEATKLYNKFPELNYPITALPTDRTPGGATVVATFAGRVFYSGFSAQVVDGDDASPRMTSYVLFSKLVQKPADVYKCYQEGDPTSSEIPELIDTDGGFLRLDGAFNIQRMVNVGDSLMVIAENGVWRISGGSGYGFNATNYLTSKVTEHGSISPRSVVILDNTFMFWSDDGIYHVAQNQYGDWTGQNLTNTTIQGLYDDIPYTSKVRCQGLYDSYQRQVRWLYNNYLSAADNARELILDVNLSAFYPTSIAPIADGIPRPISMVRVPPFTVDQQQIEVIDGSGNSVIDSSSNLVTVSSEVVESSLSEIYYITASGIQGGTMKFTLSFYRDGTWRDWVSVNGAGTDAPAHLLTGWSGMGDFQRLKQVPYITIYSMKTETGFDSEYIPRGQSSILVQSQWNWTNLSTSGKWGSPFQAYRHRRFWAPTSDLSGFDDGELVVTSRSKLRGRGRVLSLKFSTEPGKDFHLLGWSMVVGVNGGV